MVQFTKLLAQCAMVQVIWASDIMAQFFLMLCPKISTGLEKLALTGWHGWHVFATLIVQWIECSQMLTKIFQVEEKILSVRHFQLPTILPLKEIFEAICPKRWRGQVSEQEVSHAGQPRPPVNGLLRFTYAFLFFFNILLKVQFTSTHCNAFIPFLFIHLSL